MNVRNKLDIFSNKVMNEALEKSRRLMDEAAADLQNAVEEAKKHEQQRAEHELQAAIHKAELAKNRETSAAGAELRRELIARRKQIIEELFTGARRRLDEFIASGEYADYLLSQIKTLAKQYPELSVRLTPKDMRYAEKISADADVEVLQGGDFIGGFIAYVNGGHGLLDYSFRSRLEQERANFNINIFDID